MVEFALIVAGLLLGGWSLFQLWLALSRGAIWGWPRPALWTRADQPTLFWSIVAIYLALVTLFVLTPIVAGLRALGISI